MTTPDLSPEEREALRLTHEHWARRTPEDADPEEAMASLVLAALAAVPRLREIPGMGLDPGIAWGVRLPRGGMSFQHHNREDAMRSALWLDHTKGPGHHAVRLAVVEVATPTEEKDDV